MVTTRSSAAAAARIQAQQPSQVPAAPPPPPALVMACTICMLSPADPVMTICGHMFCWPCLHAWLSRPIQDQQPGRPDFRRLLAAKTCPVCRSELHERFDVFPIYASFEPWTQACIARQPPGAGRVADAADAANAADLVVPPRPRPPLISRFTYMFQPNLL